MAPRTLLLLPFILFFFSGRPVRDFHLPRPAITDSLAKKTLFEDDRLLEITLKGNLRQLLTDRSGTAQYLPFLLSYRQTDSSEISITVNIRTRGHFRRLKSNCYYPPLLIKFPGKAKEPVTYFPENGRLKLVMPCQGDDYVVREWLVYKIYNLVAPESFKARLVRIKLVHEKGGKEVSPFFGILLEEEKQMAGRNNSVPVERRIRAAETMPESFLKMAVFQYLIGNTDWSVEYQQNIKLIALHATAIPVPVPYDFDHAGIVDAPYARPAEELKLSSCRERRYRGFCVRDMASFDSTIAFFNRQRKDIYDLYSNCTLLEKKYTRATLQYLDEFYATINNRKTVEREFGYPCLKHGTGNVIIKGLKKTD